MIRIVTAEDTLLLIYEGRVRNVNSNLRKKFELDDRTQLAINAFKNNIVIY